MAFSFPLLSTQLSELEVGSGCYLEGGTRLLAETLLWFESSFSFAQNANLSAEVMGRIQDFNAHFAERYLGNAADRGPLVSFSVADPLSRLLHAARWLALQAHAQPCRAERLLNVRCFCSTRSIAPHVATSRA